MKQTYDEDKTYTCWWCDDTIEDDEVYVSLRNKNDYLCKQCLGYLEGREGYMGYRRLQR